MDAVFKAVFGKEMPAATFIIHAFGIYFKFFYCRDLCTVVKNLTVVKAAAVVLAAAGYILTRDKTADHTFVTVYIGNYGVFTGCIGFSCGIPRIMFACQNPSYIFLCAR